MDPAPSTSAAGPSSSIFAPIVVPKKTKLAYSQDPCTDDDDDDEVTALTK